MLISRFQAISLGIILGVVFFIVYIRFLPSEFSQEILSSKEKNLSPREKPVLNFHSVELQKHLPVPISADNAQTQSKSEATKSIVQHDPVLSNVPTSNPSSQCSKMMRKYEIVPGSSWGTTTAEQQRIWKNLNCDEQLSTTSTFINENANELPQRAMNKLDPRSRIEKSTEAELSISDQEETPDVGMPILSKNSKSWCKSALKKYGVKPMKSWGKLPQSMIDDWKSKQCDLVFTANRMGKRPISSCSSNSSSLNPDDHSNLSPSLPLIAIMAATTTRRIPHPGTSNLALFTLLLPSLIRSLDCGFRYEYVLGYDQGDPFYDSEEGLKEVKKWFYKNIRQPMKKNGISVKLRPVKVNNTLKKPGPVFLEMARAAYAAGADFFYRINDDTELTTTWPKIFVSTVLSLGVPYGVVGPNCDQGNQKILTHDFVHRMHMEIFEMNYYPPQLSDWWMDDWISWVYGQTRTFKARDTSVIHHTGAHGQRYQVDHSHEALLGDLVQEGRKKIRQYMLKKQVSEDILKRFDQDIGKPGFVLRDVPVSVKEKLGL